MKVIVTGFVNTMPKSRRIAGFIYLPLHIVALPLLLSMFFVYVPVNGVTQSNVGIVSNIIYYAIGIVFCLTVFWKYLRSAFDILLDNFGKNILMIVFAYIIYTMLSYMASVVLLVLGGDALTNPNNAELASEAAKSIKTSLALTVILGPIVEEILFRGVLFGTLRGRNRTWAYIITMVVFAVYHLWQYVLVYQDWRMLLFAISYLPAGYALSWLYEKTNCIWMSIFLHMLINGVAMSTII